MALFKLLFVLNLQIAFLCSAPLQIPMQGFQMMPLANQLSLQQQIMALQQLQAIQNLKTVHSPSTLYLPQPMIIMPLEQPTKDTTNELNSESSFKNDKGYIDEDLDSVIIETTENKKENSHFKGEENEIIKPKQALVILPDGRQIIGSIISSIPWLPFEVNVPDTIAWAYNGISNGIAGIISIIGGGQRNPFRPKPQDPMKPESNVKLFFKKLQLKNDDNNYGMPIIIMPEMVPFNNNLVRLGAMPMWRIGRSDWESKDRLSDE